MQARSLGIACVSPIVSLKESERSSYSSKAEERARGGSVPVKGGPLSCIKSISELLYKVVLPRQSEDALFIQAVLKDKLRTLLHQDGHQVRPKFLLIGHGLLQTLAKHSWEEKTGPIILTSVA